MTLGLGDDRRRHRGEGPARQLDGQSCGTGLGNGTDVAALFRLQVPDAATGRQQQLAAREKLCDVGDLGAVHPPDPPVERLRTGDDPGAATPEDLQLQCGPDSEQPPGVPTAGNRGLHVR